MKKIFSIAVVLLAGSFVCLPASAQYAAGNRYDLALSAGSGQFASALSWSHLYGVGKKGNFQIGYGVRLTNYFGSEQKYITAPSKFTSTAQGLGTLFSETIEANLDTVTFTKSQVNSLNAAVYLQYSLFNKKLDVGFNIDVIGFSIGQKQGGTYTNNGRNSAVSAKPTAFNLLLTSDNDIGSLNSEFYARYWLSDKWAVRAGYTFLFTEYKADTQVQPVGNDTNDRFRNKSGMLMVGVTYAPARK